jgi:hypothetical protein
MLEKKTGKRVSYDDLINYLNLIERNKGIKKKYAEKLFGIAKGVELYEELIRSRKEDEEASP